MKTKLVRAVLAVVTIFISLASYALAAGGGGGGGSSSGLGFDSRDSVYILVNRDYSEKFSLKNSTKYGLKIIVDGNVTVSFGSLSFTLNQGDNFMDLNGNGKADINFNLISTRGNVANVRIIDAKEQVIVSVKGEKAANREEKVEIEKDEQEEDGKGLKCGNLAALRERISCRLDLEKDEQEEELELYYLPEECRALSGSERGICIASYKSVQACWKFPIGKKRISCVKRTMKLGIIQEEKETCNKLAGENRSTCVRELKNKVYNLIKWHFYDLEERAEDLMQRGLIGKDAVVEFISKTEQNKINFNDAKTQEEKRNIISLVKRDWEEFADKVRENLKTQ